MFAVEPLEVDFLQVRTLVMVGKICTPTGPKKESAKSCQTRGGDHENVGQEASEAADEAWKKTRTYYLSSHPPQRAERFAEWIRGHWDGSEIRNHWVRDALWGEDGTRSKNQNLNGNLAVLRSALIALKFRLNPEGSWPSLFEQSALNPSLPLNMIAINRFI